MTDSTQPTGSAEDARTSPGFRGKVVFTVLMVTVVALLVLLLAAAFRIIPLIFISVLIAVFLRSLADPVAAYLPVRGRWAVIVVALLIVLSVTIFFTLTGPSIARQVDELAQRVPQALDRIEESLRQYEWGTQVVDSLEQVPSNAGNIDMFSRLTGFFSTAFGIVTNMTLVLVAGIYMAFEPRLYIKNLVRLVPVARRERTHQILEEGYHMVRRWLIARLISMFVVGVLTLIGLTLVGMPLALTLAVIAGLLSFIPNIGPILAAFPAILVGLAQSALMGLLAAVVYFLVQMIENYLITPIVQRKTVSLPPAIVMLTQIFLTLLFGWLGLFIAAPLVAFSIVVVKSAYVEDVLGDDIGPVVSD